MLSGRNGEAVPVEPTKGDPGAIDESFCTEGGGAYKKGFDILYSHSIILTARHIILETLLPCPSIQYINMIYFKAKVWGEDCFVTCIE